MYFPYLRARQFELIALRELADEGILSSYVMPIIEPVKLSLNNLNLANNKFISKGVTPYLIVNPLVGEKIGDTVYYLDYLKALEESSFNIAFHFIDNLHYIEQQIETYNIDQCMIICLDNFSNESELRAICQNPKVSHIVLLDPNKNRSLDRFIKSLRKSYITLSDQFEKQQRNSDYLEIPAHKFTEEHLYYRVDDYSGFSDFGLLPREYSDSGSTPRAVVIHLSYVDKSHENEIWVRHFTSESDGESIVNVQGKFHEAAVKAIRFCDSLPLSNSAITELKNYCDEERYPGLGTVKKISMKNHIIIVNEFLNNVRL